MFKHPRQHQRLGWKPGRERKGGTSETANSTEAAPPQTLQACFPPAVLWAIKLLDMLL